MIKYCPKCKIKKNISEFNKNIGKKGNYNYWCKSCEQLYYKQWRKKHPNYMEEYKQKNRIRLIKYKKEYDNLHKEKILKYCQKNKQRINETTIKWRNKNLKRWKIYLKKYKENHKEESKKYYQNHKKEFREYYRNKRKTDINYKIRAYSASRIWAVLKGISKSKTTKLIDCSIKFLKEYLQKQFKKNMTWKNYGKVWEIDHIKPCTSFDLSKSEEQQKCFHYTNLQPLTINENRSKGGRYE